jgi:hypothetical protein
MGLMVNIYEDNLHYPTFLLRRNVGLLCARRVVEDISSQHLVCSKAYFAIFLIPCTYMVDISNLMKHYIHVKIDSSWTKLVCSKIEGGSILSRGARSVRRPLDCPHFWHRSWQSHVVLSSLIHMEKPRSCRCSGLGWMPFLFRASPGRRGRT